VEIAPSSGELVTLQLTMNVPDPASITTYDQSLFADWSFAGLPLDVGFGDVNMHYPGVEAESVFGFDGSYYTAGRMQLGQAYWLLSADATTQNINGYPASEVALSLKAGWNAVSGPSCDVPLPLDTTADPDNIVNTIKTFNGGGYEDATGAIVQGQGYWVHASGKGTVLLDCGGGAIASNSGNAASPRITASNPERALSLTLRDADRREQILFVAPDAEGVEESIYLTPPLPPEGVFDIRFAEHTRLAEAEESTILLQGVRMPLEIALNNASSDMRAGYITEVHGSTEGTRHHLQEGGTVIIESAGVTQLRLSLPVQELLDEAPEAFNLQGHYPEPFATNATLEVDLPEPAELSVVVYDVLGRRVLTFSERALAGEGQSVHIDASSLASGVYLYRVTARMSSRTMTDTGRMTVVR